MKGKEILILKNIKVTWTQLWRFLKPVRADKISWFIFHMKWFQFYWEVSVHSATAPPPPSFLPLLTQVSVPLLGFLTQGEALQMDGWRARGRVAPPRLVVVCQPLPIPAVSPGNIRLGCGHENQQCCPGVLAKDSPSCGLAGGKKAGLL